MSVLCGFVLVLLKRSSLGFEAHIALHCQTPNKTDNSEYHFFSNWSKVFKPELYFYCFRTTSFHGAVCGTATTVNGCYLCVWLKTKNSRLNSGLLMCLCKASFSGLLRITAVFSPLLIFCPFSGSMKGTCLLLFPQLGSKAPSYQQNRWHLPSFVSFFLQYLCRALRSSCSGFHSLNPRQ